jgi:hypothetical protein
MLKRIFRHLLTHRFNGSSAYWEDRYRNGGNSGVGSYGEIADYKAAYINTFIRKFKINSVIEFGCGDGNQLTKIDYPNYIGLDVSKTAIQRCLALFPKDTTKSFFLYDSNAFQDYHQIFSAELCLSLDVIYHLVEDDIFTNYMNHLFDASTKFVLIFSNDSEGWGKNHVKSRKFTEWVSNKKPEWNLIEHTKNEQSPWQDFFVYQRT